jgi:hypothetical protein
MVVLLHKECGNLITEEITYQITNIMQQIKEHPKEDTFGVQRKIGLISYVPN